MPKEREYVRGEREGNTAGSLLDATYRGANLPIRAIVSAIAGRHGLANTAVRVIHVGTTVVVVVHGDGVEFVAHNAHGVGALERVPREVRKRGKNEVVHTTSEDVSPEGDSRGRGRRRLRMHFL